MLSCLRVLATFLVRVSLSFCRLQAVVLGCHPCCCYARCSDGVIWRRVAAVVRKPPWRLLWVYLGSSCGLMLLRLSAGFGPTAFRAFHNVAGHCFVCRMMQRKNWLVGEGASMQRARRTHEIPR
jgi:hypothetical protein